MPKNEETKNQAEGMRLDKFLKVSRIIKLDVRAGKAALVDAGRGDPDVAVFVKNRQVAAGSGGHAVLIDAVHDHHQLVCGMHEFE